MTLNAGQPAVTSRDPSAGRTGKRKQQNDQGDEMAHAALARKKMTQA